MAHHRPTHSRPQVLAAALRFSLKGTGSWPHALPSTFASVPGEAGAVRCRLLRTAAYPSQVVMAPRILGTRLQHEAQIGRISTPPSRIPPRNVAGSASGAVLMVSLITTCVLCPAATGRAARCCAQASQCSKTASTVADLSPPGSAPHLWADICCARSGLRQRSHKGLFAAFATLRARSLTLPHGPV